MRRNTIHLGLFVVAAAILIMVVIGVNTGGATDTDNSYMADATYIESGTCNNCHSDEHTAWAASLHPTKIRVISADNVVPNPWDGTTVTLSLSDTVDVTVTLSVDANGDYYAKLDATDTYKYKISHVLGGVGWKQRYVTEDIGNSKYILPMQWNLETSEWVAYHATDWYDADTGAAKDIEKKQSWDRRCLGCHTTGGEISYTNDEWIGTYNELGIGCEGCHGPGSLHQSPPEGEDRTNYIWKSDDSATCGNCHTRGSSIGTLGEQTMGYPVNEAGKLIQPGDTIADFYTLGLGDWAETGVSKQHHQQFPDYSDHAHSQNDIECVTCHDQHGSEISNDLKVSKETTCTQCHTLEDASPGDTITKPQAEMLAGTISISGITGTAWMNGDVTCTDCHMPRVAKSAVNYDIASHTFDFISPQLSIDNEGMPNSCTVSCHDGTTGSALTDQEAADHVAKWKSDTQAKLTAVNAKLATAKSKLDAASGDVASETTSYNNAAYARDYVEVDGTYAHNPTFAMELLNYAESTADDVIESLEGGGTPGFEFIAVIAALGVAFILLRRRK